MEQFITLWNDYRAVLPINEYEFDKYMKIITKLRNQDEFDIQDKQVFIELIDIMAETIYTTNSCADKYETKYGTTYYQQTRVYEEPELNYCSELLTKIQNEIMRDIEDGYDKAFYENVIQNIG